MMIAATPALFTPADSARAVSAVYTTGLLATVPLGLAALVACALRHASARARALAWRSTLVSLVLLAIGHQCSLNWFSWAVPSALAGPLVALGRLQVTSLAAVAGHLSPSMVVGSSSLSMLDLVLLVYVIGLLAVLVPTALAMMRGRRLLRRAARAPRLEQRGVRVFVSGECRVPMTWGWRRPVVVLPAAALAWSDAERGIAMAHELSHARAADWLWNTAARLCRAIYWFHPGAWWLARELAIESELACDERVLAAGVRRSDYAELLVRAAESMWTPPACGAVALSGGDRGALRDRLRAVLDTTRPVRPFARAWAGVAAIITFGVAAAISGVQLAPSRGVLTRLMRDARWESRAYAVMGLARHSDTVAVARTAAERDPNPRVRAWARYALATRGDSLPGALPPSFSASLLERH